ncbi:MAG: hypothetical protein HY549_01510 [Elusimicrobia bacterium]|nr:hypothetical protein [Elusimicrobiota bacterium]
MLGGKHERLPDRKIFPQTDRCRPTAEFYAWPKMTEKTQWVRDMWMDWRLPLTVGAVIVLIFGGYEFIERAWLHQADPNTLHTLHIFRGIGATIIASTSVILLINRRFDRLMLRGIGAALASGGITDQVEWFINLRWIAASVAAVAVFASQHILHLLPGEVTLQLWLGIATLWLLNVVFSRLRREFGNMRSYLLWLITTDLLILTYLLHFSGGLENPLFILYTFHVIIAGILLSATDAYLVSSLVAALFLLLAFGEYSEKASHYTLSLFPHFFQAQGTEHASHQLPFVVTVSGTFLVLIGGTTFFTTAIMQRLRESHRHLLQTERLSSLGQLTTYIAHEVNNPIGIISTRIKLARSNRPECSSPQFLQETLEIVDRQADRVGAVVQSLLNLSKPQLQPKSPVDLNEPLSEALYLASGRLSGAGVALQQNLADSLPKVSARHNDLVHGFLNIINNAVDAMPRGGLLKIETGLSDGWIHADIADTGAGMAAENLEKIFDPFYTTKKSGTGLGLPISLALIKSLGGEIKVGSSLGQGSRFTIRLPVSSAG